MAIKHLDPRQLPELQPEHQSNRKSSSGAWLLAAALVVAEFGGLGTWLWPVKRTDHVSPQERESRQSAFTHLSAIALPTIVAESIGSTLDSMRLGPSERGKLREMLSASASADNLPRGVPLSTAQPTPALSPAPSLLRLVSVTLWDTHDQDGDIVTVSSAGYQRQVVLTNAPQTVSFPIDQASVVQFSGVHDGGGGITLGIRGPNLELLMPIMSEGQTLSLPVVK